MDETLLPRYPIGTPEYNVYRAALRAELKAWVEGTGEYALAAPAED